MAIPWPALILLKEASDFIQVGMVAYQNAQRFSQTRQGRGGQVGIDGNTVRVQYDSVSMVLPLDDAAAAVGVAGAGGHGRRVGGSIVQPGQNGAAGAGAGAGHPAFGGFGFAQLSPAERAAVIARGEPVGQQLVAQATGPKVQGQQNGPAMGPDTDARPFTLREFIAQQEQARNRRQQLAISAEQKAAAIEARGKERLAALDAQIERERIAAEKDITRMKIVADLQLQRADLATKLELQRLEAQHELQVTREKLASEERQAERKFEEQRKLQDDEQAFKSTENERDRKWRQDTWLVQQDVSLYYKNAAADTALNRSLYAARAIAGVLRDYRENQAGIVSFASVWGRS